jgi:hypothetical protein
MLGKIFIVLVEDEVRFIIEPSVNFLMDSVEVMPRPS